MIAQRNIVLSDQLTDLDVATKYLKNLGFDPYVAMDLSNEMWELKPDAFGQHSWFGWLLANFRSLRTFTGMSVNDVAHVLAQTCVQENVAIDRGLLTGGGCDYVDYNVVAVTVHEDTMGLDGFWPLAQAIRFEQARLDLPEMAIYTHCDFHKLQLFVEHPVHVSHL